MTVRFARNEAERLIEQLAPGDPPVQVEDLAQRLGLRVLYDDLGSQVSGVFVTDVDRTSIVVHQDAPLSRQRFAIAHAIGHFTLRHQFGRNRHVHVDRGHFISQRIPAVSEGIDREDLEANQFAASLLMPAPLVRHSVAVLVQGGLVLDRHVEHLAKEFQVSEQAMTVRLIMLGLL